MADLKYVFEVDDKDLLTSIKNHEILEKRIASLKKEYAKLDSATNSGKIHLVDYAKATQQLDQKIDHLESTLKKGSGAVNQLVTGMNVSGKASRNMELRFQQAGYQLQDFVVQVQSGTNPLIAFSQQGSQLAGFFAGPWGAMIGLGIAALSSFAMVLLSTREKSKSLEESLEELNATNEALRDFGKDFGKDLVGNIEAVRASFGNLVADIYAAQLGQVQEKLKKEFSRGLFSDSFAASFTAIKPSSLSAFDPAGLREQGRQEVEIQTILNRLLSTKVTSQEQLASLFSEAYDALKNSNSVSEEGLKVFQRRAKEFGFELSLIKEAADVEKTRNDILDDEAKAKKQILDYQEGLGYKLDEQIAQLLEAQGLDEQALSLRKQAAYEQARANVLSKTVSEQQRIEMAGAADAAGKAASEAVQLAYEVDKAKESSKTFADHLRDAASSMSSLTSLGTSIERALSVSDARVQALKNKSDATVAATIAGYRFDIKTRTDKAIADARVAGQSISPILSKSAEEMDLVSQLEKSLTTGSKLTESNKTSGGAVAGKIDTQEEYLAKLSREYDMKKKSLGLTDQQIKRNEFIFTLDEKIATMKTKRSELEIETERQKAIAAYDAFVAGEKQNALMKTVSSNMTTAFMSMVDGSNTVAGAFKNMMLSILKSVYEQSVAQPLASSLTSALFAGISGKGPQTGSFGLPSFKFADGGVVGSPTTFQMSGGKTGLMGEAGPEAILPLKRGSNGKLGVQMSGGSGAVTVNNNINVTGSDAAAVRMEVAKMIPQITNATKAAIIDAKKRGGQMGAAFS